MRAGSPRRRRPGGGAAAAVPGRPDRAPLQRGHRERAALPGHPRHPVRLFGGAAQPRGEPMVSGAGLGAPATRGPRVNGASGVPGRVQTFLPLEESGGERCDGQLAGSARETSPPRGGTPRGRWGARLRSRGSGAAGWVRQAVGGGGEAGSGPAASCESAETRSSAGSSAHVCVHVHVSRRRLLVGAPTASWLANASVVNPGAIYRCKIGENPDLTCEQLQLGELGLGPGASDPGVAQVAEKLHVACSSLKGMTCTLYSKNHLTLLMQK